ncbi:MAG TPA: glutamate synthase [Gammaproteobacteria bacterium]|nr:glutamate synthase [Gammaproteobacteria bacterium]
MNISGVLVRARPEKIDSVRAQLERMDGVEVHGANPDGRLVVTVEEDGDRAMADTVVRMQDLPGVIAASMIYHEYDDSEQIAGSQEA